jgi:hypothetical protein
MNMNETNKSEKRKGKQQTERKIEITRHQYVSSNSRHGMASNHPGIIWNNPFLCGV